MKDIEKIKRICWEGLAFTDDVDCAIFFNEILKECGVEMTMKERLNAIVGLCPSCMDGIENGVRVRRVCAEHATLYEGLKVRGLLEEMADEDRAELVFAGIRLGAL